MIRRVAVRGPPLLQYLLYQLRPPPDLCSPVCVVINNLLEELVSLVLNEVRRYDYTSWIWNKVRIELKDLAKRVERDLAVCSVEGIGIATVTDGTVCAIPVPHTPYIITFECLNPLAPDWVLIGYCCGIPAFIVAGCVAACFTGPAGCISCILTGAAGVWASFNACYQSCPVMDVCLKVDLLFWRITVACARLWG